MKVHDARDGFHDLKPEHLVGYEIPWFWIAAGIFILLMLYKYFPKREKKNPMCPVLCLAKAIGDQIGQNMKRVSWFEK